jgi:hypothetical protein
MESRLARIVTDPHVSLAWKQWGAGAYIRILAPGVLPTRMKSIASHEETRMLHRAARVE